MWYSVKIARTNRRLYPIIAHFALETVILNWIWGISVTSCPTVLDLLRYQAICHWTKDNRKDLRVENG